MKRRTYLASACAAAVGLLAGCGGSADSGSSADSEQTSKPTPEPTPTQTPAPEPAVNIEETLFQDARWPRELEPGMVLRYEVDVREGGPAVLSVSSEQAGDLVFDKVIKTQASGKIDIEHGGVHYIQVGVGGETAVTITSA